MTPPLKRSRGSAASGLIKFIVIVTLLFVLLPMLFKGCSAGGPAGPSAPSAPMCIDAVALQLCGRGDRYHSGDTADGAWWNPWYWAKRGTCWVSDYKVCDVSWEKEAVGLCTSQGHMITAFEYVPNSLETPPSFAANPSFNCHGHSFTADAYWIDNPQVQTILDDDYTPVTTPRTGDIVIYRTNGAIVHSARWVGYPPAGIDPRGAIVSSKGGFSPTVVEVPRGPGPGTAWEADPAADVTYYRRCLRSP